jgi:dTDP-4-amino-4,6-dideoxygalactose transaminase
MAERPWSVPLSDIAVDDAILGAAAATLASGWWSTGPRVAEFEHAFAEHVGAGHAVAVSSGTAALHLALAACDCGPGDEVVMPALTFVAAASVVRHLGATPVFCDVLGAHSPNLDPADLEGAVGPRTKAIVPLHYGGVPCDMAAVLDIAERHRLAVIEDAAHAPGATYRGYACGTLGDAGCFSFFSNKNLPIGEGGMVVTGDAELADRIRRLRSHGMTALSWDRERGHAAGYDVLETGFNYRLDEPRAAIGLVQLARLGAGNAARARRTALYRERLAGVAGLTVPDGARPPETTSAEHLAVVVLPRGSERAEVRAALAERRIQTSVHYPPVHRFSAYGGTARPLPRTDDLGDRLLTLPLFPHMAEAQVHEVADALLDALAPQAARVHVTGGARA